MPCWPRPTPPRLLLSRLVPARPLPPQGSSLDGHKLALQLSTHKTAAAAAAGGEGGKAAKQVSRWLVRCL